jgi:hypothetical protein
MNKKYLFAISALAGLLAACVETTAPSHEGGQTSPMGYENEKGEWVGDSHHIEGPPPNIVVFPELDENGNELKPFSTILTWDSLPVAYERNKAAALQLPNGETHWYETVYLPEGGVNWVQAKALAEQAGGHLVTIHSEEENTFVFELITHPKYWYAFDHGDNLFVLSGPFLGGFQAAGAREPDGDWRWVTGEPMSFIKWQKEGLDIGIKSKPDNQPNNSRDSQHVMAYGEVDVPAPYWSDVPHGMGTYDTPLPPAHGFIIEYNNEP